MANIKVWMMGSLNLSVETTIGEASVSSFAGVVSWISRLASYFTPCVLPASYGDEKSGEGSFVFCGRRRKERLCSDGCQMVNRRRDRIIGSGY